MDDGSVDLITLFDTIEHVPDDERVLRECRRALAGGGLLFLSVPAYQFLYANNDRVVHHQRRYTARELRRKLTAVGFRPTQVTYFNTLLFPAILPMVLAKKVQERFSAPDDTTNLSHGVPRPLKFAACGHDEQRAARALPNEPSVRSLDHRDRARLTRSAPGRI